MDKREQMRLDALLVERGLVSGRDRAKELIAKGAVLVNGALADKPSQRVGPEADLTVLGDGGHYVSRAAEKLRGAMEVFSVSPAGRVALDVGASTGGFTQYLLEHGAKHVYAVDVGTDQLAPALRRDPRVTDLQQTDIRALSPEMLPEKPSLVVCDVSFISLRLVLPAIKAHLAQDGEAVVLIKPQFEAGRAAVGRTGVVKDPKIHLAVLREMEEQFRLCGFVTAGLEPSSIRGGDGNIEFLAWLRQEGEPIQTDLPALVRRAHAADTKGKGCL